eukprot:5258834-Ditylum_brightwellii.AAC.1
MSILFAMKMLTMVLTMVTNDSVGNGDDDGVDDGLDSAEKHLVHLSQVADCCQADRSEQNEHLVCNEDDDVDDGVDDGDNDSEGN